MWVIALGRLHMARWHSFQVVHVCIGTVCIMKQVQKSNKNSSQVCTYVGIHKLASLSGPVL